VVLWLIKFAMCTLMPKSDALPGIRDTHVDQFLRRMRREAEGLYWLGLVVGAVVFMITPIVTVYLPLPACFLPKKLLARHAERVVAHRIYTVRQAVFLVRLSAGMCWGADEHVRAAFALGAYPEDAGTFRTS
jgi:hypothetical protein